MIGTTLFTSMLSAKTELQFEKSDNFVKKHVKGRCARLILIPASFTTCALDTIYGLGVGIGAICTGGKKTKLSTTAFNYLTNSNLMLSIPYSNLLRMINPKAEISSKALNHCDGILSHTVNFSLKGLASKYNQTHWRCMISNNSFKHHIASRLTYALLAVACVVARAVDGIIGVAAATLSIVTVGKFTRLNDLAWKTLQPTGIIEDLWFCTMHCINPDAL